MEANDDMDNLKNIDPLKKIGVYVLVLNSEAKEESVSYSSPL